MNHRSVLASAAVGVMLVASTFSAASAANPSAAPAAMAPMIPAGATLTNAKGLAARRLLPNGASLTGMLQQTSSCNKVQFLISPAMIVPPIYRAVQIPVRRMPCLMLTNHWVPASIKIGPRLPFVTVQAKNGTTKVIVH